jgi:hypothetical protein
MAVMSRIASALLIAAAVLAVNAGMLRDAFSAEAAARQPTVRAEIVQPIQIRSAKVLSLLVILESLRQESLPLDGQKV